MQSVDDYVTLLQTTLNARGRAVAPKTIQGTRSDLRGFVVWWETTKRLTFDPTLVLDRDLTAWQKHRQAVDGVQPTTINRANASLRTFFTWATATRRIGRNPATTLRDLPIPDLAPRGVSPDGMDWLERIASGDPDPRLRLRDLALLTLLYDGGLRRQEASDVQLRDLDLAGATLTVRAGKNGQYRRVLLTAKAVRQLRMYLAVRCPAGLPPVGSDQEREPLLESHALTVAGQPWRPGLSPDAIRWRITDFGHDAAVKLREQAKKEASLERVGALLKLADQLAVVTPHQLRHGLAYKLRKANQDPTFIQKALGHTRASTSAKYGKPTEDDVRAALEASDQA